MSSHKKKLHHDWRTWVVVILMLAAMGTYVLTMDDEFVAAPTTAPAQP